MSNQSLIDRAEEFMTKAPYLPLGLAKEMIAALREQTPQWINVNDRLPEDETLVIAYIQHIIGWYCVAWRGMCGWHSSALEFDKRESDYITHWMPLPEPPMEVVNA